MEQKQFWVYISLQGDHPDTQSMALLGRAQQLAEESEMTLAAVVAGGGCSRAAKLLAEQGVPMVYYADVPDLKGCEYLRIADILYPFVKARMPEIFLFPATDSASLLASTLGVRLQTGVNVHCVSAEIRDGIFIGAVPAFGGQVMSEILCPVKRPQMATVRLSGYAFQSGPVGNLESFATQAPATEGLELVSAVTGQTQGVSLTDADVVLCGGAGVRDAEGWQMLKDLADAMGAAVCCTRNALDMGIGATEADMVGISGSTIAPKAYIGFGVSGSAHHMCGMKESTLVLNVNLNRNNPFFVASDCGYVGDAKQVIAALTERINK